MLLYCQMPTYCCCQPALFWEHQLMLKNFGYGKAFRGSTYTEFFSVINRHQIIVQLKKFYSDNWVISDKSHVKLILVSVGREPWDFLWFFSSQQLFLQSSWILMKNPRWYNINQAVLHILQQQKGAYTI